MSNNFPLQSAYDSTNDGTMTGFVMKFNYAGALVFSTYLGGSGWDRINSVALDSSGRAHVAGETCSNNFPTQAALQATYGGNCDMFVTKFNAAGSSLVYSTYVGGSQYDVASLIAMDSSSNYLVVGGTTASSNFPLRNAFQSTRAGGLDGVALRIRDTGVLDYSTYIGGTGDDGVTAVAVSGGQPILTGYTASTNFPVTLPIQATNGGLWDAFVVKLSSTFVPQYSTYLGGGGYDFGAAIAIDSSQNIYVAGATGSTNFPTQTPFQATNGGGTDAFVTKLSSSMALVYSTYLGGSGEDEAWGIAMTGTSNNAYVVGWTSSNNFPGATPLAYHGEYRWVREPVQLGR